MFKKITVFISALVVSILIMLPVTYIYASYKKGVLFFSAFLIAFLCSLVGFLIWHKFYKEKFEGFLSFCTIFLISAIFIYFGPVTLDRSLSSFIYFYSVENGQITRNIYDEDYFSAYIQRRFEDGKKIGFLDCDENYCRPTFKTKLVYYILYPCGIASKTLNEYYKFDKMMDNKTKN